MPNPMDSIPNAISQRALISNASNEEKDRRESAIVNKDFYYDKQEQALMLLNDEQLPFILNLTKPIVKKRASMLYSTKLVREFEGPANSITALEQIYKDNNIDHLLSSVDLMAELTGSVLVFPETTDTLPGGIRLRLYDASAISPLQNEDNPNDIDALSVVRLVDRLVNSPNKFNAPQIQRVLKQQIWTKDSVVTYDGNELISSETHGLGFIPFVNFKGEEVHDQYLGHAPGLGIRLLNEDINQLLTDMSFMIKMQSATPIAISGWSGDSQVLIHPGRAFNLPAGALAEVLKLDPKILEVLDVIKYTEEKAYEITSVPKVSVVGNADATSGKELLIKWFPLLQLFEEKAGRYQVYELQLANCILRILGLPELQSLVVKFNKDSVLPLSAADDSLEKDIEFSIKTPIDEVMRRDPLLTEEEAQAKVLANADINEQLGLTVSAREALNPGFLPGRDGRVPSNSEDEVSKIRRELRIEHPDWDQAKVNQTAIRLARNRKE
jgi:hypothetical protein